MTDGTALCATSYLGRLLDVEVVSYMFVQSALGLDYTTQVRTL
jgi:hypothetical protein